MGALKQVTSKQKDIILKDRKELRNHKGFPGTKAPSYILNHALEPIGDSFPTRKECGSEYELQSARWPK